MSPSPVLRDVRLIRILEKPTITIIITRDKETEKAQKFQAEKEVLNGSGREKENLDSH